jgi:hypothetical protein
MKARCILCGKKPGKLPSDLPIHCSLKCVYQYVRETHMDWEQCEHCLEWMDKGYGCSNDSCPSNDDSDTLITADELNEE